MTDDNILMEAARESFDADDDHDLSVTRIMTAVSAFQARDPTGLAKLRWFLDRLEERLAKRHLAETTDLLGERLTPADRSFARH